MGASLDGSVVGWERCWMGGLLDGSVIGWERGGMGALLDGSVVGWERCCDVDGGVERWNGGLIKIKKEKRYLRSQPFASHVFPRDKRSGLTTTNTYRHICTDGTFMMFCEFFKTITLCIHICLYIFIYTRWITS